MYPASKPDPIYGHRSEPCQVFSQCRKPGLVVNEGEIVNSAFAMRLGHLLVSNGRSPRRCFVFVQREDCHSIVAKYSMNHSKSLIFVFFDMISLFPTMGPQDSSIKLGFVLSYVTYVFC